MIDLDEPKYNIDTCNNVYCLDCCGFGFCDATKGYDLDSFISDDVAGGFVQIAAAK